MMERDRTEGLRAPVRLRPTAEPDSRGLVPGISVGVIAEAGMDGRNKSGHDERGRSGMAQGGRSDMAEGSGPETPRAPKPPAESRPASPDG